MRSFTLVDVPRPLDRLRQDSNAKSSRMDMDFGESARVVWAWVYRVGQPNCSATVEVLQTFTGGVKRFVRARDCR